jgi:hypothetical protein
MNNTCFESGDQAGITQHPPVVNWRNSGVGVGVIVAVGSGVFVGRAVGKAATVDVAENSSVVTGTGTLDVQAVRNKSPSTQDAIRITSCIRLLASSLPVSAWLILILHPYRLRYQSGGHGTR